MRHALLLFLSLAALGSPRICHAQSDADRILSSVRNQVVALRVFGDKAPTAQWPDKEPPIWGTGFVVGPLSSTVDGKERIITAGHVVEKDNMWAQRGLQPSRVVYPWVLEPWGRQQIEGFQGVSVNGTSDTSDIAQVYGPRGVPPVVIQSTPLSANDRYFAVSWGLDENQGIPTEEPYVKEIKVVTPAASDSVDPGLVLVEALQGQSNALFKPSESGSPVFDLSGRAVAIMIQQRTVLGVPTRGIALPFNTVSNWLSGVRQNPIQEPAKMVLADLVENTDKFGFLFLNTLSNTCVFLGKYSARNKEPSDDATLADAPMGIPYLKKVISLFPEAAPDQISDADAVMIKQLPEPDLISVPPRSAVQVRSFCPNVVPKPKRTNSWERLAFYGAELAVANSRFQMRIARVQRQAYLEDFFYWGEVQSVSTRAR